jgi:hypothetical protein
LLVALMPPKSRSSAFDAKRLMAILTAGLI